MRLFRRDFLGFRIVKRRVTVYEYFRAKQESGYRLGRGEARMLKIPWPLRPGWLHRYGPAVIFPETAERMKRVLRTRPNDPASIRGLEVLRTEFHVTLMK